MKRKSIKNICIGFPPYNFNKSKGLISKNRGSQYFYKYSHSYPLISSMAATMLKKRGYSVSFLDAIIRDISTIEWFDILDEMKLELLFFEVTTPLICYMWEIVYSLKNRYPNIIIVLGGEHVSALPFESMENCNVDYILKGANFDFLLMNLVEHLNGKEKLDKGIVYRTKNGNIKNTDDFIDTSKLRNIPFLDRDLTEWSRYAYNTDFRKHPITYIMSGRYYKCNKSTNSSLPTIFYENSSLRDPIDVVDEIEFLVNRYNVKEIIDITKYFPLGEWLFIFCQEMIDRKLNKKVILHCNVCFGTLQKEDYRLMKEAGFKSLFFYLQLNTVNILDKLNEDDIIYSCKEAKREGLSPHITLAIGHYSDTENSILDIYDLIKNMLKKGYIDFVDANILIPYPGTELFSKCKSDNLLLTENWLMYDFTQPIIKNNLSYESIKEWMESFYNLRFMPIFLIRSIFSIRSVYDIKYYLRVLKKVFGENLKDSD